MINVYIYNVATGEIVRSFYTIDPELIALNLRDGEKAIDADPAIAHPYVLNGALTERPENPSTLNGTVIENIPVGATVSCNDQRYTVDDGVAELEFAFPGDYSVTVACFPYLTKTFEVSYAG